MSSPESCSKGIDRLCPLDIRAVNPILKKRLEHRHHRRFAKSSRTREKRDQFLSIQNPRNHVSFIDIIAVIIYNLRKKSVPAIGYLRFALSGIVRLHHMTRGHALTSSGIVRLHHMTRGHAPLLTSSQPHNSPNRIKRGIFDGGSLCGEWQGGLAPLSPLQLAGPAYWRRVARRACPLVATTARRPGLLAAGGKAGLPPCHRQYGLTAARYLPVAGTCRDTCPQANTRANSPQSHTIATFATLQTFDFFWSKRIDFFFFFFYDAVDLRPLR